MAAACGLDRLIGDPRWCLHPVQVMGAVIGQLRLWVEAICGDRPLGVAAWGRPDHSRFGLRQRGRGFWALEQLSQRSHGECPSTQESNIAGLAW